jgi:hypothetical protein
MPNDRFALEPPVSTARFVVRAERFGALAYRVSGAPTYREVDCNIGPLKGKARLTCSPEMSTSPGVMEVTFDFAIDFGGCDATLADLLEALCEQVEVERERTD